MDINTVVLVSDEAVKLIRDYPELTIKQAIKRAEQLLKKKVSF